MLQILVVHEKVPTNTPDADLRFVMIAQTETVNMVSRVVTFKGRGRDYTDNPYILYGKACAAFVGLTAGAFSDYSITVAGCEHGDLERFGEGGSG